MRKKKIIWKDLYALAEDMKAVPPKPKDELEATKTEAAMYLKEAVETMHARGWTAKEICDFIRNSKSPLQVGQHELRTIINSIIGVTKEKKKTTASKPKSAGCKNQKVAKTDSNKSYCGAVPKESAS